MKNLKRHPVDYLLIVIVIIGTILLICSSCAGYKGTFIEPSRGRQECELQPLGKYDTSAIVKENFFKGSTTTIYLQDDSYVSIWGKKCNFVKNEMIYAKPEFWGSIGLWKHFAVNKELSKRYTLLRQR